MKTKTYPLLLLGIVLALGIYTGLDFLFQYLRPDIGTTLKGNTGLDPFTYAFSMGAPFILKNTGAIALSTMFLVPWTMWVVRKKK